jgi:hypothetical protein
MHELAAQDGAPGKALVIQRDRPERRRAVVGGLVGEGVADATDLVFNANVERNVASTVKPEHRARDCLEHRPGVGN